MFKSWACLVRGAVIVFSFTSIVSVSAEDNRQAVVPVDISSKLSPEAQRAAAIPRAAGPAVVAAASKTPDANCPSGTPGSASGAQASLSDSKQAIVLASYLANHPVSPIKAVAATQPSADASQQAQWKLSPEDFQKLMISSKDMEQMDKDYNLMNLNVRSSANKASHGLNFSFGTVGGDETHTYFGPKISGGF